MLQKEKLKLLWCVFIWRWLQPLKVPISCSQLSRGIVWVVYWQTYCCCCWPSLTKKTVCTHKMVALMDTDCRCSFQTVCVFWLTAVFSFIYLFRPIFPCGGHLITDSGIVASEGFPDYYKPNSKCTWYITVSYPHQFLSDLKPLWRFSGWLLLLQIAQSYYLKRTYHAKVNFLRLNVFCYLFGA